MLKNTFVHVPSIGLKTEKRLWDYGILGWNDISRSGCFQLPQNKKKNIAKTIRESRRHLEGRNPVFFQERLPSSLHWRMFPEFRSDILYLDIETTGLASWENHITSIATYNGNSVSYYVHGQNLEDFTRDVYDARLLVTYNGKSFDIPFIEHFFRIKLHHAHIDLRYVLASLGFKGGLKGCERQLNIDRGDLINVDGYFAVLLWEEYRQNKNQKALETLLAYNIQDTVNLETLMVIAYNLKLKGTPFAESHQLTVPPCPYLPFEADRMTIEAIRRRIFSGPYIP
jgi:uncharacterized protein YprB with RNaseH-like and TPR domain